MKNKLLLAILAFGFISVGFTSSVVGPLLLSIKKDIPMDYFLSGIILSAQFFGIMISVLISGYFADKYGKKRCLFAGSLFLISGLAGSTLASSYIMLLTSLIIVGLGYGVYNIGLNSISIDYIKECSGEKQAGILNSLHFFFGIGAILGPILVSLSTELLKSWRIVFAFISVFPFLVNVLLVFFKYENVTGSLLNFNVLGIIKNYKIWILGIAILIYVGIEVSVYGWLPSYYEKSYSRFFIAPSLTATMFWISLSSGRLFLTGLINKMGVARYILISSVVLLLLSLLWVVFSGNILTLVLASLIGLVLSCLFPSILVLSTKEYPDSTGVINSIMFTFGSLGGFVIPSGIGKYLDLYGIGMMPVSILFLSLLFVASSLLIWKRTIRTK